MKKIFDSVKGTFRDPSKVSAGDIVQNALLADSSLFIVQFDKMSTLEQYIEYNHNSQPVNPKRRIDQKNWKYSVYLLFVCFCLFTDELQHVRITRCTFKSLKQKSHRKFAWTGSSLDSPLTKSISTRNLSGTGLLIKA